LPAIAKARDGRGRRKLSRTERCRGSRETHTPNLHSSSRRQRDGGVPFGDRVDGSLPACTDACRCAGTARQRRGVASRHARPSPLCFCESFIMKKGMQYRVRYACMHARNSGRTLRLLTRRDLHVACRSSANYRRITIQRCFLLGRIEVLLQQPRPELHGECSVQHGRVGRHVWRIGRP
jgi:hypothetical protein